MSGDFVIGIRLLREKNLLKIIGFYLSIVKEVIFYTRYGNLYL